MWLTCSGVVVVVIHEKWNSGKAERRKGGKAEKRKSGKA